jgi:hypothetical protein
VIGRACHQPAARQAACRINLPRRLCKLPADRRSVGKTLEQDFVVSPSAATPPRAANGLTVLREAPVSLALAFASRAGDARTNKPAFWWRRSFPGLAKPRAGRGHGSRRDSDRSQSHIACDVVIAGDLVIACDLLGPGEL